MTQVTQLPPPTVVVVDRDARYRVRVAARLGDHPDRRLARSIPRISVDPDMAPAIVVFGPSFGNPEGLDEIAEYLRDRPLVSGILATEELSTPILHQALRAGLFDVIAFPDGLLELDAVIDRAADHTGHLISVGDANFEVAPAGGPAPSKVITVFGTKGGSGKSFVASNLAILLARESRRPVCLIDADLQFGDAAVMLSLTPSQTIADVVGVIDRLDPLLTRSLLVRHEPSGLLVLPAPLEPAFADQIAADDVMAIVDMLRTFCAYVVVDTPAYFTDVVIRLVEESDEILLVAGMDVPNIKNVKLGLKTMRLLEVPDSKIRLVLNRTKSKAKMDVGDVERVLGRTADALIPSDIVVPQSVNEGVPVVISAPKSAVARSIETLAALFLPKARPPAAPSKS